MKTQKENGESNKTNAQNGKESKETDGQKESVPIQKEVLIKGMNEDHRSAIVEPIGYEIGEKAKCPFIKNLSFEFEVTGEKEQIIIF